MSKAVSPARTAHASARTRTDALTGTHAHMRAHTRECTHTRAHAKLHAGARTISALTHPGSRVHQGRAQRRTGLRSSGCPHLHRDCAQPTPTSAPGLGSPTSHICTGTAPSPLPTSTPGLGSPTSHIYTGTGLAHCPQLHRDCAQPASHIYTGTGLAHCPLLPRDCARPQATTASGLRSAHCPHLHRDCAHPLPTSASGLGSPTAHILAGTGLIPCTMTLRICLHCTGTGLVFEQASN
jgi:hypothetical protein